MATYFISDLHLSSQRADITALFLRFLATDAKKAAALYILGDLFETWIGDDTQNPHDLNVMEALANLHQAGVPVYFMHGNRDFLIGKVFAKKSQCILLPDPTVIHLHNHPVLLTHGDLLCTLDLNYQQFRRFVRHPFVQKLFLSLPLFLRQKIADFLRHHAGATLKHASDLMSPLWDVSVNTVNEFLRYHHTTIIIHGHTHKAKIHEFLLDNHPAKRIVLGDWDKTGSALLYFPNKLSLEKIV